jgi:hypothetical protein
MSSLGVKGVVAVLVQSQRTVATEQQQESGAGAWKQAVFSNYFSGLGPCSFVSQDDVRRSCGESINRNADIIDSERESETHGPWCNLLQRSFLFGSSS